MQIYLGNSARESTTLTGRDSLNKFKAERDNPIVGETSLNMHYDTDDSGKISFTLRPPNRTFITPILDESNFRYEHLLNTVIGESTHSLLYDSAFNNLSKLALKYQPDKGIHPITILWPIFDPINEGVAHATSLLYLELNPNNKAFVERRLNTYNRNPRYSNVLLYHQTIHEMIDDGVIDKNLGPIILLKAFVQGFPNLEQGKDGLRNFIDEHYKK